MKHWALLRVSVYGENDKMALVIRKQVVTSLRFHSEVTPIIRPIFNIVVYVFDLVLKYRLHDVNSWRTDTSAASAQNRNQH